MNIFVKIATDRSPKLAFAELEVEREKIKIKEQNLADKMYTQELQHFRITQDLEKTIKDLQDQLQLTAQHANQIDQQMEGHHQHLEDMQVQRDFLQHQVGQLKSDKVRHSAS